MLLLLVLVSDLENHWTKHLLLQLRATQVMIGGSPVVGNSI